MAKIVKLSDDNYFLLTQDQNAVQNGYVPGTPLTVEGGTYTLLATGATGSTGPFSVTLTGAATGDCVVFNTGPYQLCVMQGYAENSDADPTGATIIVDLPLLVKQPLGVQVQWVYPAGGASGGGGALLQMTEAQLAKYVRHFRP